MRPSLKWGALTDVAMGGVSETLRIIVETRLTTQVEPAEADRQYFPLATPISQSRALNSAPTLVMPTSFRQIDSIG